MGFLEEEVARRRLLAYVEALEAERQKMLVFHRELPFSLELVSRALESYRLQLAGEAPEHHQRPSSEEEETSSEGPVLKEFMPTAKGEGSDEEVEEEEERDGEIEQRDWLRSVQLHDAAQVESPREEDLKAARPVAAAAFLPPAKAAAADEKDARGQRKARRCWSPDLHHRFLQALQQLGGSHVATPKQIRDLMKVEGLTNDEVKSHLQKYRLHTSRKSPPAQPSPASGNSQAVQPQIVFVGSLWTPPGGPAAAATRPQTGNNASPFVVLRPQAKRQKLMGGGGCGGSSNSESTATTTSSAHTITTTESPRS